jgi:hypothetical protein
VCLGWHYFIISSLMPCILKIKFNFVLVYIIRGYHS